MKRKFTVVDRTCKDNLCLYHVENFSFVIFIPSNPESSLGLLKTIHHPKVLEIIEIEIRFPNLVSKGKIHINVRYVDIIDRIENPVILPQKLDGNSDGETEVLLINLIDIQQSNSTSYLNWLA